jgi:hypothetical protein
MFKKLSGITFLLVACFFINCVAAQPSAHENISCSISKVVGHKAYLKQGSVQIAKNGIFIYVEGQLVAINHLDIDDQGVYFDLDKVTCSSALCPLCARPLLWGLICTNSDCPARAFE